MAANSLRRWTRMKQNSKLQLEQHDQGIKYTNILIINILINRDLDAYAGTSAIVKRYQGTIW